MTFIIWRENTGSVWKVKGKGLNFRKLITAFATQKLFSLTNNFPQGSEKVVNICRGQGSSKQLLS